jgi:hypothetical protein
VGEAFEDMGGLAEGSAEGIEWRAVNKQPVRGSSYKDIPRTEFQD